MAPKTHVSCFCNSLLDLCSLHSASSVFYSNVLDRKCASSFFFFKLCEPDAKKGQDHSVNAPVYSVYYSNSHFPFRLYTVNITVMCGCRPAERTGVLVAHTSSVCSVSAASCTVVEADAQRCCQDAGERMEAGLLHHVVVVHHLPALLHFLLLFP